MTQRPVKHACKRLDCLNCGHSFSLPAGEAFDDGTVVQYDRLVCVFDHKVVLEGGFCEKHTENNR